jgi:hypothetical protein
VGCCYAAGAFSLGSVLGLLLGNDIAFSLGSVLGLLLGSGTTMGWYFLWGPFRRYIKGEFLHRIFTNRTYLCK